MNKQPKFTLELANKIKKTILERAEGLIDNVFIVGGVAEKGYSNNDLDIIILWALEGKKEKEVKLIKEAVVHMVRFTLKNKGLPIENIDIYSYTRCCVYNLVTRFNHPSFYGVGVDE